MESAEADLADVADLLRARRRVLQPEDVGLPRGPRRRTPGLRRDEVAALCSVSSAYYGRLERRCGPRPSPTMLANIARGLRFARADRDRLFSAAGYDVAAQTLGTAHVNPGVMHVLGRLADTPAMAVDALGGVLHQTPSAKALFGDASGFTGWSRSGYYRWFTDPAERQRHDVDEHVTIGHEIVRDLRRSRMDGELGAAAAELVKLLLRRSAEFAEMWRREPPLDAVRVNRPCRVVHPALGVIDLQREVLFDRDRNRRVVIYLTVPGSESHTKLKLATVIGHHRFDG
ncbi:helix-turn-helix transcriptional regulator [Mycobacterium sp. LTG2003]